MKVLVLSFLLICGAANAQTLPAVPDSAQVPKGYWMQVGDQPNLVAPAVFTGAGVILSSIFIMADNRSLNDLGPGALIAGVAFGGVCLKFSISIAKKKRFVPYTALR